MVMSPGDLVELTTDQLLPALADEQLRLERIDLWYRGRNEAVEAPHRADEELKRLIKLATTPWLGLVVTNVAQNMRVSGYRTPEMRTGEDGNPADLTSPSWRRWKANGLDKRQGALHRATLAYGSAYGLALPGVDQMTGERMAVMRGVSPRKMLAFYQDPAEDDWPMYALRWMGGRNYRVYDDEAVYYLGLERNESTGAVGLVYISHELHEVGVCPLVRFTNVMDLDGRTDGEVEPFIPLARRIDKTDFDRMLIQHFQSWKVRTVAGMAAPTDEQDANRAKLKLRHDDVLVAEDPDTKFGTLPETPLDGILKAKADDVKTLAAVSQTPVHALTGDLINLSAEALAAARSELDAKVGERQLSTGTSHAQWLRLAAHIDGDAEAAADVAAEVTWADTSVRSMSQAADALGKIATQLGVPVQALWGRIPGVNGTDVEEWKAMAAESDSFAKLAAVLEGQAGPAGA